MKNKFTIVSILALFLFQSLYAESLSSVTNTVNDSSLSDLSKKEKIEYIYKTGNFTDNTYANLMFLYDFSISTDVKIYTKGFGFGMQYGKWLSPYNAIQVGFAQGFSEGHDVSHLGVDYVFNLSNIISYKEDRSFSVLPFVGITGEYINRSSGTDSSCLGISVGAQLRYRATEMFDVIFDARTSVSYENHPVGNSKLANISGLRLGGSYRFNQGSKYKKEKLDKYNSSKSQEVISDDSIAPVDSISSVELIDIESSDIAVIDIEFSMYSDHIDFANKEIISTVALWLKEQKDGKIEIISFNDKGGADNLSDKRNQVIFDEFIKNGISEDDLKIIPFGENKYKFKNPANAVIVFIPNK